MSDVMGPGPALVDDQPAPHRGEQLKESLQEEADRKRHNWETLYFTKSTQDSIKRAGGRERHCCKY